MVKSINELRDGLKNTKFMSTDITNTLLELDVLPSVGTQADLNDMLVELYNNIVKHESIEFEAIKGIQVTPVVFVEWVRQHFTEYSYTMFFNTIHKR